MSSLLVHSDIRGFTRPAGRTDALDPKFREELLKSAFQEILSAAKEREVLLPAFNYDFTQTSRFDVREDSPQVGRIPKEAMLRPGWHRSRTPVFSFLSNKRVPANFLRPFSELSIFSSLTRDEGEILLLGTNFSSLTFIHHVEHMLSVPYRYEKSFSGEVVDESGTESVTVEFHVRPKGLELDYDFQKIGRYLFECSAASQVSGNSILISATRTMTCLSECLERDPLFLLNEESYSLASREIERFGGPLRLDYYE